MAIFPVLTGASGALALAFGDAAKSLDFGVLGSEGRDAEAFEVNEFRDGGNSAGFALDEDVGDAGKVLAFRAFPVGGCDQEPIT